MTLRSIALLLPLLAIVAVAPGAARTETQTNPIVAENHQAGTTSWQFTNYNKAEKHEIEGYASLTSVNKGDQISFMVSLSSSAQYTMDFYRMGWYPTGTNPDGTSCAPSCGGRLMQHVGPLNGALQPACPMVTSSSDSNYGMVECNWTPSYTLSVPTTWTQGVYLVKLTRLDGSQLQNYMTFVVRDDASTAPVLYSLDTNTWQAYNFWGGAGNGNLGINLYGRFNDVTLNNASGSRAYTVSFDRPYLVQGSTDGAGNFFVWDFPLVRWMESQGYDMTYVTDTELESKPTLLSGHRVFVNTGHDEYYSDTMRSALENGVGGGVNLALFSANNVYFRVNWSSDGSGRALRRIHTSKGSLPDSTTEFRNLTPARPENALLGVMQNGVAADRPYLVYDASSWIYAGTGLVNYSGSGTTGVVTSGPGQNALPGIVGYEFDERATNAASLSPFASSEPAGIQQVGHSFVPASDNGVSAWSDAILYTAPSGATVFSAGTIQWPYTLDNGYADGFCDCDHHVASAAGQKITANILGRFGAPATPTPVASWAPSTVTFSSQTIGTTSSGQAVTLTNAGTAPMTIASIGLTGANAGDYAETTTCPTAPATLAVTASCTLTVTFAPTATGTRSASLSISDDAPASPQAVALSGTGAAPAPAATLTPTTLAFGSQSVGATSAALTSTLRNSGTGPLTITSIATGGTRATDYAQTNTCPATLAVGATCTISVTFKPLATGSRAANVTVTDNAANSPQRVTLSGTGVTSAAGVSLSPTTLAFGSQRVGTTGAAQVTTLTNSGTAALTISAVAVTGDFAQTNTCPVSPATLAAGASCTLSVGFSPTAAGARSGSLTITDNAAGSPHSVGLSGTGTAPSVSLAPTSLGFGTQPVGATSTAQSSTLTNAGTAPLTISGISVTGANAGDFARTTTCPLAPATLAAGGNCTITATFTPSASGARSASVSIADDAPGTPHGIGLTGTGATAAPAVTLAPASLAFGSQRVGTTGAAQVTTLTNSGTAALTISAVAVTGDFSQTNTCPATLAAGASCALSVVFSPTASGARSGSLTVTDGAAGSPHSVGLSGTGTAPVVSLSPASLGFGTQAVGATGTAQSTTLTNSGTAALTISGITVVGANSSDFAQTNTCPASLSVGATCSISATFTPSAAGSRSASLSIADDASGAPHSVGLTGTGAAATPAVTLAPATLAFDPLPVGTTSAARTTTLTNSGNAPLTITQITAGGDFAQTNTCPTTLAAGANCTISVTFTPSAAGSRSGLIVVSDDAPDTPQAVSASGTGIAPAASLAPAALSFAQLVGTTSGSQTVSLTNTGTAPLTLASVGTSGSNASEFAFTSTCPVSPSTLAPGAQCTVSVTFTPTAPGNRSASLQVTDDASDSPQTVALTGTATAPAPAVTLSPSGIDLGSQRVGTSGAAQSATLTNTGTASLTIGSLTLGGANPGDFAMSTTCPQGPATLAAGASCTVSASFQPTAAGSRAASISIADDATGSPHLLTLAGTGTAPAVTLTPASIAFGSQSVGTTSSAQTTTLRNSGTAPLALASIAVIGANSSDFVQTNTCPASLAVGATCSISATFTPSAAGSRSASLSIADDGPDSPQTVTLSGTGSTSSIAFDRNLGAKNENVASTTMTLSTSGAASVHGRVFLFVGWYHTSRTLTSVSGGGLTWTVDVQTKDSTGFHGAIASADAPAGLPAGTVVTATFSGSVTHGLIAAASFTGIASATPVDGTATKTQGGVAAWSAAVTTTNANDLVLGWSGIDSSTAATSTPVAPALELHDFGDLNYGGRATSVYRIETTTGSKSVGGTWAGMSGSTAAFVVAAAYRAG